MALGVTACLVLAAAVNLRRVVSDVRPTKGIRLFECARTFEPLIEPGCLIVASAPAPRDRFGLGRTYNARYLFSLPEGNRMSEELAPYRRRGATYLVAERATLARPPAFAQEIAERYRVLADCDQAMLFALGPAEHGVVFDPQP